MPVIDLSRVPATVQLDLCDLAYRKAGEYFKDPSVQARYKVWLEERRKREAHLKILRNQESI